MKKNIFIVILLIGCLFKSQDILIDSLKYRADYQLSYQNDSIDVYSKDQENFILFIGNLQSLFVSENTFKRDSLKNALIKSRNISGFNLANVPKSEFSYRIVKNRSDKSIVFYDLLFRTSINYKESVKLDWDLTDQKEKIGSLMCGIAYVNYGGRRYKTWYSSDIPIPEGPYKFFGLPGLIIKMEDTKGHYKFELLSFKDKTSEKELITMESRLFSGTSTTKHKYLSAKDDYINNLGEQLKQSGIMIGNDAIKNVQKRERKKNNPIELK